MRERVSCLIILLREERRYTRITLWFHSQGVEQFVREGRGMFGGSLSVFVRSMVRTGSS